MVYRKQGLWVFQVIRPGAQRVYLVGEFNGWSKTTVQMQPNAQGVWETSLALKPGVYRFRYFADNQWLTDYAAFGVERNATGEYDSILLVPEERTRVADHVSTGQPEPSAPGPRMSARSQRRRRPAVKHA